MRRPLIFSTLLACTLAVLLPACKRDGGGDPNGQAPGGKPGAARVVPVTTAPAEQKDVPVWLEGLGTVAAWQQVTVHTQVDGRLDKVFFTEGQHVKQGEVLAQIDPRPFLVQLHQAEGALQRDKATLENAKLNEQRYKQLADEKLIAVQQATDQSALVGQSEGALRADEAAVESARLNLDYARIKSPCDGVVGVRLVDPGNIVHAADQTGLVVITMLDPAALYITVPQDDLVRVMDALQRGPVAVQAFSRDGESKLADGALFVVDNQINTATGTLRLKARMPNPDRRLWPNQFVKARLLLSVQKGALVVAPQAIQRGPNGTFVYVVDAQQKAQMRPVNVLLTTADYAVLKDGVTPGEQIVVEGQNQLRPGSQVSAHVAPPKPPRGGDGAPRATSDDAAGASGAVSPRRGDNTGAVPPRRGDNTGVAHIQQSAPSNVRAPLPPVPAPQARRHGGR